MTDFDLYVKKYAEAYKITEEEAKSHALVMDVKKYYEEKDKDKIKE